MKKTILSFALVLTLCQIGLAQTNFDKTKLDNYFNQLEENTVVKTNIGKVYI